MIIEFTDILIQTDTKILGGDSVTPHLINDFRYNWSVKSELMKVEETFKQWLTRKEEDINTRYNKRGGNIDGIVIFDWEPVVPLVQGINDDDYPYNIIRGDKKMLAGAGIIRYDYLRKNNK